MPVPDMGCLWHSLKLWLNYYSHPYRVVCMVSCEFTSTEVIRLTGDLLKCIFVKEIALILLSISPNWVRKWPSWQYASTDSVQVNSVRADARPLPEPIMIAANWRLHASPSFNELMYHFMCSGLCSRIIFSKITLKNLRGYWTASLAFSEGYPPPTNGFLSRHASNAEKVSTWWRH